MRVIYHHNVVIVGCDGISRKSFDFKGIFRFVGRIVCYQGSSTWRRVRFFGGEFSTLGVEHGICVFFLVENPVGRVSCDDFDD